MNMNRNRNRQAGHVITEWVILTFLITTVLFAPIPGYDQSVTAMLMESIRDFHKNSSFLISLP
ncbi:MAG: hypothetical protein CSB48_11750 [Proteobacteria bacterium]|nr:MAG: hypothetical protein CSB48_11750 [Pseudomonadota bacterium]